MGINVVKYYVADFAVCGFLNKNYLSIRKGEISYEKDH